MSFGKCPFCGWDKPAATVRVCPEGHKWWEPNNGPQKRFLASKAFEVLYGGAAGGGKTQALLAYPLRWIGCRGYSGVIFRNTYPELEASVIKQSWDMYPLGFPDAKYSGQSHAWRFSSGAEVKFAYLQYDDDRFKHKGSEFCYVGFDELTSFTEVQYTYLISRMRSVYGHPIRLRASTNPGGPGMDWVLKRWAPWLDRSTEYMQKGGLCVDPETVLWCKKDEHDRYVFSVEPQDDAPDSEWRTRSFIPARAADNAMLMVNDPGYVGRLKGLSLLERKQLLDGDWLARPAKGLLFKRLWFDIITTSTANQNASRCRYWDRAATEGGGDWTVGVKMARVMTPMGPTFVIEDVIRFQGRPAQVEATIRQTAIADGRNCAVVIEQDPGQAGKFEAAYYVKQLAGFNVRTIPVTKDKVVRAQPASAQAEKKNIALVQADWNLPFLNELEEFPEGNHDDIVDATTGAFNFLTTSMPPSFSSLGTLPTMPGPRM